MFVCSNIDSVLCTVSTISSLTEAFISVALTTSNTAEVQVTGALCPPSIALPKANGSPNTKQNKDHLDEGAPSFLGCAAGGKYRVVDVCRQTPSVRRK